jgi:threonyl-tRNA synthetase
MFSAAEAGALTQVVGDKEEAEGTVNVRTRDNVVHGMHALEAVQQVLLQEKAQRSLTSLFAGREEQQGVQNGAAPHGEQGAAAAAP